MWGNTNIQTSIDDDSFGSDSSVNGYDPVTHADAWYCVVTPRHHFCRGPDTLIPFLGQRHRLRELKDGLAF